MMVSGKLIMKSREAMVMDVLKKVTASTLAVVLAIGMAPMPAIASDGVYTAAGTGTVLPQEQASSEKTAIQVGNVTASTLVYTGKALSPKVKVVAGKATLKAGRDYTVTVKNAKGKKVSKPKAVGKYAAVVTGKGSYKGTVKATFNVVKPTRNLSIAAIGTQRYTGKAVKPELVVTYKGKALPASKYKVKYKNNVKPGTATATVVLKSDKRKKATAKFKIYSLNGLKWKLVTNRSVATKTVKVVDEKAWDEQVVLNEKAGDVVFIYDNDSYWTSMCDPMTAYYPVAYVFDEWYFKQLGKLVTVGIRNDQNKDAIPDFMKTKEFLDAYAKSSFSESAPDPLCDVHKVEMPEFVHGVFQYYLDNYFNGSQKGNAPFYVCDLVHHAISCNYDLSIIREKGDYIAGYGWYATGEEQAKQLASIIDDLKAMGEMTIKKHGMANWGTPNFGVFRGYKTVHHPTTYKDSYENVVTETYEWAWAR